MDNVIADTLSRLHSSNLDRTDIDDEIRKYDVELVYKISSADESSTADREAKFLAEKGLPGETRADIPRGQPYNVLCNSTELDATKPTVGIY